MVPGAPRLLATSSPRVRRPRATPQWPQCPPHSPSLRHPLSLPRVWEAILRPEVTRPRTTITPEATLRLTVIEDPLEMAEDPLMTLGVLGVPHMMGGGRHLTMATEAGVAEATEVLPHAVVLLLNHEARRLHTGTPLTAGLRGQGGVTTEGDIEAMKRVLNKLHNFIYIMLREFV